MNDANWLPIIIVAKKNRCFVLIITFLAISLFGCTGSIRVIRPVEVQFPVSKIFVYQPIDKPSDLTVSRRGVWTVPSIALEEIELDSVMADYSKFCRALIDSLEQNGFSISDSIEDTELTISASIIDWKPFYAVWVITDYTKSPPEESQTDPSLWNITSITYKIEYWDSEGSRPIGILQKECHFSAIEKTAKQVARYTKKAFGAK